MSANDLQHQLFAMIKERNSTTQRYLKEKIISSLQADLPAFFQNFFILIKAFSKSFYNTELLDVIKHLIQSEGISPDQWGKLQKYADEILPLFLTNKERESREIAEILIEKKGLRLSKKCLQAIENGKGPWAPGGPFDSQEVAFMYRIFAQDDSDLISIPIWPTEFFHPPVMGESGVTPVQILNPVLAQKGQQAFQGQTAPSQKTKKKKLLLTAESQGTLSDNHFFALVGALLTQHFEIIFKTAEGKFLNILPREEPISSVTDLSKEPALPDEISRMLEMLKPKHDALQALLSSLPSEKALDSIFAKTITSTTYSLDLSGQRLGEETEIFEVPAVSVRTMLEKIPEHVLALNLSQNKIYKNACDFAKAFANSLRAGILALDLSANKLGKRKNSGEAMLLLQCIPRNLRVLNLSWNHLSNLPAYYLETLLRSLPPITYLDLSNNSLGSYSKDELRSIFRNLPGSLTHVILDNNKGKFNRTTAKLQAIFESTRTSKKADSSEKEAVGGLNKNHWNLFFEEGLGSFNQDEDFETLRHTPELRQVSRDNVRVVTSEDLENLSLGLSQDKHIKSSEGNNRLRSLGYADHLSTDLTMYFCAMETRYTEYFGKRTLKVLKAAREPLLAFIETKNLCIDEPHSVIPSIPFVQLMKMASIPHSNNLAESVTVGCVSLSPNRDLGFDMKTALTSSERKKLLIIKIFIDNSFTLTPLDVLDTLPPEKLLTQLRNLFPNAVKFILPDMPALKLSLRVLDEAEQPIVEWFTQVFEEKEHTLASGPTGVSDIYAAARMDKKKLPTATRSTTSSYLLHKTATYLAGQPFHELRTGIYQFEMEEGSEDISTVKIYQTQGRPADPAPSPFDARRLQPNEAIYQLRAQSGKEPLPPHGILRLDSLSPQEEIYFETPLPPTVEVFRGSDDFFYLKNSGSSPIEFDITVQLKARHPRPVKDLRQLLAKELHDPAKTLLHFITQIYMDPAKGFTQSVSTRTPLPPFENRAQYQRDCFDQRAGTCAIRSWCVYEEIKKLSAELALSVRVVNINNNHARLEIFSSSLNTWFPIDLGGGNDARLTYAPEEPTRIRPQATPPLLFSSTTKTSTPAQRGGTTPFTSASLATPAPIARSSSLETVSKRILFEKKRPLPVNLSEPLPEIPLLFEAKSSESALKIIQGIREGHLGEAIFYLNSQSQLSLYQDALLLNREGELETQRGDELGRFLQEARRSRKPAILMINWDKLPPKSRVALNEILAKNPEDRTLEGIKIPTNIHLISFSSSPQKEDSAFQSRHQHSRPLFNTAVKMTPPKEEVSAGAGTGALDTPPLDFTLDLQAKPHWKEEIFGRIVLKGRTPHWEKADWIPRDLGTASTRELLTTGEVQKRSITLKNIDPDHQADIRAFIAESEALGYFNYEGYHIPTSQLAVDIHTTPLSFEALTVSARVTSEANWKDLPHPETKVINTQLFDYLLLIPELVYEGTPGETPEAPLYVEKMGYLESHKDQKLSLFITRPLSTGQWFCLLQTAEQFHVELDLSLASGVTIPEGFKPKAPSTRSSAKEEGAEETKGSEAEGSTTLNLGKLPKTFLSSAPERDLPILLRDSPKPWVIDVEDFNYADLIESRDYQTLPAGRCSQFQVRSTLSAVMQEVQLDHPVILKGQFSDALLELLQPLLLDPKYKALTLLVELPAGATSDARFHYHPVSPQILSLEKATIAAPLTMEEKPDPSASAQAFIDNRKSLLLSALKTSPAAQLIGPPGVGKSSLIRELEIENRAREKAGEIPASKIYREMAKLESWAKDQTLEIDPHTHEPVLKILFIDEANLDDRELTQFADLLRGGRDILIKNTEGKPEKISLTENHRIVFAGNPLNTGGERFAQKLFELFQVPQIHLENFSKNYLIERLLGPITGFPLPDALPPTLLDSWIHEYESQGLNIRALQEKALHWKASQIPELNAATRSSHPSTFVITESLRETYQQLEEFIRLRKAQYDETISRDTQGLGLGGVFIQGKPGLGKTEMIRQVLQHQGYELLDPAASPHEGQAYCDKIDAGLPLNEKKSRLLNAFEHGWSVWIDEFDACTEGLEKFINALMTGQNPETGEQAKHPGFIILGTGNGATMSGRKELSEALDSRCLTLSMPNPSFENVKEIIQFHHPEFSAEFTQQVAAQFMNAKRDQPWLNIRDLVTELKDVKAKSLSVQEAPGADLYSSPSL